MLDARKLARMSGNRARMRQGRSRTVTLVYRRPGGTAYVAENVVWREQQPGTSGEGVLVRAEFALQIDPREVTYVAATDQPDPAAVAQAPRYRIVSYRRAGIVTNRWVVALAGME